MRRIWINNIRPLIIFAASLFMPACQVELQDQHLQPQEVGFYAGGSQTRTEMLSDGLSAIWEPNDQIALWATNSAGTYVLNNQVFQTYGIDDERGFFTSVLDSPMADGTYTYYCCYPAPASVSGTTATFNLPAEQDGKVRGGADIMIGDPTQHGPLLSVPDPEDHTGMSMKMNRMMHQFRFFIPEDNAAIGDEKIKKMIVTFPSGVVGTVSLNVTDPTSQAVLSNAAQQITLNLSEPIGKSTSTGYDFACMAIAPRSFAAGDAMTIKAYTEDMIAEVDPIDLCARNFQAGHSTPVRLLVKAISDYPYKIVFTVSGNNLGEDANSIIFSAPEGCVWGENKTNVYTYTPGHKITTGEQVVFRFEDQAEYLAFANKDVTVTFDTDNVLTSSTIRVGDTSASNITNISAGMPYLLYQDFSQISGFNDGHDNPNVGMNSDTYSGISELSSYSGLLSGWYAARIGVQANTAARICCRYQDVIGGSAYYKGRLYTPFITMIKDGATPNISVSFRYGSDIKEPSWGFAHPGANPLLYFGVNTEDTVTNPDEAGLIDGVITQVGYGSMAPSSLAPMAIRGEALATSGGSYTSFAGTKTVTIENFDNHMRLGWIVSCNNTKGSTNGNYWLYIDDIKVQIAK